MVGSDIDDFNHAVCLTDEFVTVPSFRDPKLWEKMGCILESNKIDLVIPSFDETLLAWAERADIFKSKGTFVLISPAETIRIFTDKWKTYEFFCSIDIPTPRTSLSQIYGLVKPRNGRGARDIYIGDEEQDMTGMISQEVLIGQEYTIDCLFNTEGEAIYIVPRKRLGIRDGKSTKGITVKNEMLSEYIKYISDKIRLVGPINFQAFVSDKNEVKFIEVNPRIAGGMALGIAATENWFGLIGREVFDGILSDPKDIKYNLKMARYYAECFVSDC